ncbi:MAG: efflux RND transporter permease subunit [Anaerobacillus sp.]
MKFLTRFSLKNSIGVLLLTILVLAAGIISTNQIKVETYPDVTFPALIIQGVYPGGSTEAVEQKVTTPIENSLENSTKYDNLTSTSSENASMISLVYPFGTDIEETKRELEDIVSKADLPEEAEVEVISMSAGARPVYEAALSSEDADELQKKLEDVIVPELEGLEGVNNVSLSGTKETTLSIKVDEEKASEYGLTLNDIKDKLKEKEYSLPLGSVEEEETTIPVKLQGSIDSLNKLKNTKFNMQSNQSSQGSQQNPPQSVAQKPQKNQEIVLEDFAEVTEAKEKNEISRFNGQESFLIQVTKRQDENTKDVVDRVKEVLGEYETDDVALFTILDQGEEVEKSISSLLKEGGFGALFTVIVILLFLRNIRATIIAIISLPISILGTIGLLDQFGYTLNIMTLGGLAVAVGRIVDDSIVVIENIYRWRQENKEELSNKALTYYATKEVLGAIASSTIATLVVFLPLAFVGGILGEFFRPFSLAVVFSISISLLVALMLIPVLGSAFFKKVKHHEKESRLSKLYERFIRGALKKKALVIVTSVVLLAGSLAMIPALGVSFLPAGESDSFELDVALPATTQLEDTNGVASKIEDYLDGKTEIDYSQVSIGISSSPVPGGGGQSKDNETTVFIKLANSDGLQSTMEAYEKDVQNIVEEDYEEGTVKATEVQQEGPPSGNTIDVSLYGDDQEKLTEAATQVEELLTQDSELTNVSNNLEEVQPKWTMSLTEEGEEANVSPFQVMQLVNSRLQPLDGGTIEIDDHEWEMSLSYGEEVTSKQALEELQIPTANGSKSLSDVASIKETTAPVTLYHDDGRTSAAISADIKSDDTAQISQSVEEDLSVLSLPEGVEVEVGGGQEMINDGFADLGLAMIAAILLVFFVLSLTFRGIITPIVILSSLIFVPIGSLAGLLIAGQTLSMSAMIGMLMLIGIVVTNAVVLLDRVEKNRMNGLELTEALVEAAKVRLRPIIMTALATIFALIPLALSNSASGLISKGLAITVIGGLTTSTLLTLVFVPVFYAMIGKYRRMKKEQF